MFGVSFLSPLFLAGAAAAAIPVLLHLFLRRTDPVVPFAAMRYLRHAPVEQASRRRVKEWVLLALRVAALILLAVAFARPYLTAAASGADAPATLVLVDTSASLTAQGQFDRARTLAAAAVRAAEASDLVGVMAFGTSLDLVVPLTRDRAAALQAVASLRPGAGAARYAAALGRAAEVMAPHPGRIVVVTDLQESGWDGTQPFSVPGDIGVEVADVGAPDGNLAVTDLRIEGSDAVAVVRNYWPSAVTRQVTMTADGERVGAASVTVAAEGSGEARLSLGSRRVEAVSATVDDPGGYAADNTRYALLDVAETPLVLAVTTSGIEADALYFLRALAVSDGTRAFQVQLVSGPQFSTLADKALDDASVVALLGTRGLEHQGRERLAGFVKRGGGLLVAAGPAVDAAVVRETLGNVARSSWSESRAIPLGFAPNDTRHPIFRLTGGAGTLAQVAFTRTVLLSPGEGSVVARFTDGSPALVDEAAGRGRVLVFASDLNQQWNDFPLQPAFVPFVHESLRYLAAAPLTPAGVLVGELNDPAVAAPGIARLDGARGGRRIAVNVDPRESNPARIAPEAFEAVVSRLNARAVRQQAVMVQEREDSDRLWQYALLLMLTMLAAESALGRRVA